MTLNPCQNTRCETMKCLRNLNWLYVTSSFRSLQITPWCPLSAHIIAILIFPVASFFSSHHAFACHCSIDVLESKGWLPWIILLLKVIKWPYQCFHIFWHSYNGIYIFIYIYVLLWPSLFKAYCNILDFVAVLAQGQCNEWVMKSHDWLAKYLLNFSHWQLLFQSVLALNSFQPHLLK